MWTEPLLLREFNFENVAGKAINVIKFFPPFNWQFQKIRSGL